MPHGQLSAALICVTSIWRATIQFKRCTNYTSASSLQALLLAGEQLHGNNYDNQLIVWHCCSCIAALRTYCLAVRQAPVAACVCSRIALWRQVPPGSACIACCPLPQRRLMLLLLLHACCAAAGVVWQPACLLQSSDCEQLPVSST